MDIDGNDAAAAVGPEPAPERAAFIVVGVVLALVAAVIGVTYWLTDPPGEAGPAPDPPATPAVSASASPAGAGGAGAGAWDATAEALEALRAWDSRRGDAWAAGDLAALRGLYAAGSAAGRADVAMLRRWTERGLTVEGMSMQVLAVEVAEAGPRRLRLRVTDRLVGAVAVGDGVRRELPRDRPTTRELVMIRAGPDAEWRVASVAAA